MGVEEIIAIIEGRRANFRARRSSGPGENLDEAALLIADEYDILLAKIAAAIEAEKTQRDNGQLS
jgi:hypothetical protein